MELKPICCPNCGAFHDDYDPQAKTMTCNHIGCGATFRISQAEEFAKVQIDHEADIKNLRQLLDKAIEQKDSKLIEQRANDILKLIPDDAFAAYCGALGQKMRGLFKEYEDHLGNTGEITQWGADRILAIALTEEVFSVHDEEPLKAFVQANYPEEQWEEKNREIAQAMNHLVEEANRTASIPRDVFICHSSKDAIAHEVYDILKNDGSKCWTSEQNITKHTVDYWKAIYEAIEKCTIFLVISSQNSMLSKDVQKEVTYAERLKKDRLELKIDDTEHTELFKFFFDGIQWIRLGEDKEATFKGLKERVFKLLHKNPEPEPEPVVQPETEKNAPLSNLIVHYVDNETQASFRDETRELQPGTHHITPNPECAPKGALFCGETVKSFEIPPAGGIQKEITFRYKLPVKAVSLIIRYTAQESGDELAREQRPLSRGRHNVAPNEDLIPPGYIVAGENKQSVTVNRHGAEPNEIVFECRLLVPPVSVQIRYVLKTTGKELASEQRLVNPGRQIIDADEKKIPSEYRLLGDRFQEVNIGNDSTNPVLVTFECRLKIEPAVVRIRYTDSRDKEIADPTTQTLPAGTHTILPNPVNLPKEYKLCSHEIQTVTVAEYGARPETVVFCYKAPNIKLQKWQNYGKTLIHLLCAVWLLLLIFNGLNSLRALPDAVFRELPFLYQLNHFLVSIQSNYGPFILPFGRSNLFTFLIFSGTLLILVASLPFGARIVQWNARHLSYWLYLLIPSSILLVWTVKMPYSVASGILQDKLIFLLEFLAQPALALVVAKLLEKTASKLVRT